MHYPQCRKVSLKAPLSCTSTRTSLANGSSAPPDEIIRRDLARARQLNSKSQKLVQICKKSRRIGCVIPYCKLQCGITQPTLRLFLHICITRASPLLLCVFSLAFRRHATLLGVDRKVIFLKALSRGYIYYINLTIPTLRFVRTIGISTIDCTTHRTLFTLQIGGDCNSEGACCCHVPRDARMCVAAVKALYCMHNKSSQLLEWNVETYLSTRRRRRRRRAACVPRHVICR